MEKYKNKDGIQLSYTGNDSHQVLVREVIREACNILTTYNKEDKVSMNFAIWKTRDFLVKNFDLQCKQCNREDGTCGCRKEDK